MPQFNLSCDYYKSNFLNGFAHLQQEQEFVDLMIAVDGHIVKVHKNVMALASPYLRDIMKKSPSGNLVIYLNSVNYKDFGLLLEYIYQGEVNVPEDRLQCFMLLAQSLHVTGIDRSNSLEVNNQNQESNTYSKSNMYQEPPPELSGFNYQENNSSEFVAVNANHNYGGQPFSEDMYKSSEEPETATLHITNIQQVPCVSDSVEVISDDESIDNTELEDVEDIPVNEHNDIPADANVKANAPPENYILEPNEIPSNSIEEINIIPANSVTETNEMTTDTLDMTEFIVPKRKEEANKMTSENIQVPPSVLEIANNKDIPLNKLALVKDGEIPTDIHIIIPKLNDAETADSNPLTVTVKPLSTSQETSKKIPPTIGPNFQLDKVAVDALKVISQYSVTERGSIQIIVSRYIYNSHHVARGGRKHRWRCLHYRRKKCPAFIDSLDNRIVLRKGNHDHEYHDDKIYKKHAKGQIYHSLKQAEAARKKPRTQAVDPESGDTAKLIDVKRA